MRIGQSVRVVAIPQDVVDTPEFPMRSILEQCIGKVFPVMELRGELLALDVEEMSGKESYMETIYIEQVCVEVVV